MRKLGALALMLSAATLGGCSTSGIAIDGTAAQICKSWEPIKPSKKDVLTDGTAKQIVGNNAAQQTWCGKAPAKGKTDAV